MPDTLSGIAIEERPLADHECHDSDRGRVVAGAAEFAAPLQVCPRRVGVRASAVQRRLLHALPVPGAPEGMERVDATEFVPAAAPPQPVAGAEVMPRVQAFFDCRASLSRDRTGPERSRQSAPRTGAVRERATGAGLPGEIPLPPVGTQPSMVIRQSYALLSDVRQPAGHCWPPQHRRSAKSLDRVGMQRGPAERQIRSGDRPIIQECPVDQIGGTGALWRWHALTERNGYTKHALRAFPGCSAGTMGR